MIQVAVDASASYLLGFPMVVAVTLENTAEATTWFNLPAFGVLSASGPVGFLLRADNGKTIDIPSSFVHSHHRPASGFDFGPREQRRMLFDVSIFRSELAPGIFELTARYRHGMSVTETAPVQVLIAAPTPSDRDEALRLLGVIDTRDRCWPNFISFNMRTVDASRLSPAAYEELAFHLFVHRAVYGPVPVEKLDIKPLQAQVRGPLLVETELMELEIAVARGDADAFARAAGFATRWPSLQWRIEAIQRNEGMLRIWRRSFGVEREYGSLPTPLPYTAR